MNRQRIHLLPLLVLLALMSGISAKAQRIQLEGTVVKPSDEHIQYIGRFSFKNPDSPAFTYPGVQINARFEGTSLKMLAKPMSGLWGWSPIGNLITLFEFKVRTCESGT